MNYEAVILERHVLIESEKEIALERITKLVPGLWEYGRAMTKKVRGELIVELQLDSFSKPG
jgi:hypothetical protein